MSYSLLVAGMVSFAEADQAPVAADDVWFISDGAAAPLPADHLLANDTDADGDSLSVTAVSAAVNGGVSLASDVVSFLPDAGATAGSFDYTVDDGNGGSDTGTVSVQVVHTTDGADTVEVPLEAGFSYVDGLGGDDSLTGRVGLDTLLGGAGNDTLLGGNGADSLDGGSGNDSILAGIDNDLVHGGSGDDYVFGDSGNDSIFGQGSNDTVDGGNGADSVDGGFGDDSLLGGNGLDTMLGGGGLDNLSGQSGNDYLDGGTGNDTIDGGADNDTAHGGSGVDSVLGSTGNDVLFGEAGNDTMDGGANNDSMEGGADQDIMTGGSGNDTVMGNAGDDTLDGGTSNDVVSGGAGNDRISGGVGSDHMRGGTGVDTFVFLKTSESPAAHADHILDFDHSGAAFDRAEGDVIDLQAIDANTRGTPGDQAFTSLVHGDFTHTAAQLRWFEDGADIHVEADVNGDGNADFAIVLIGNAGNDVVLADFVL